LSETSSRFIFAGKYSEEGDFRTTKEFFEQLEAKIVTYDLLCHPFYKAWGKGELTRADLRDYARDYYHHVEAFPSYLAEFGARLQEGGLRRAVEANRRDEQGDEKAFGEPLRSHPELWLDFVEGMGASRNVGGHEPVAAVQQLIAFYHHVAREATLEGALAAFYAYESQVPRVSRDKARGLREIYGADERTRAYFTLHMTADVYHAQVWRQQLETLLEATPEAAEQALDVGGAAAEALWRALDGIEERRLARAACVVNDGGGGF
jgi:pyrroloquinoline-quinone synthase